MLIKDMIEEHTRAESQLTFRHRNLKNKDKSSLIDHKRKKISFCTITFI